MSSAVTIPKVKGFGDDGKGFRLDPSPSNLTLNNMRRVHDGRPKRPPTSIPPQTHLEMSPTEREQQQDSYRDLISNDHVGRSPDDSKTADDFVYDIESTADPHL